MTHDEFQERLDAFTDSAEDAVAVLSHAASCAVCAADRRAVERELARAGRPRGSAAETLARSAAAAVAIVVLVLSFSRGAGNLSAAPPRSRTVLVVGDASGVTAYTPSALLIGTSARRPAGKENTR